MKTITTNNSNSDNNYSTAKKALCPYSDKNDKTKNSASNLSQLSLNIDFFARSFLLF